MNPDWASWFAFDAQPIIPELRSTDLEAPGSALEMPPKVCHHPWQNPTLDSPSQVPFARTTEATKF